MICNICNSDIIKNTIFNLSCPICKYYIIIKHNQISYISFTSSLHPNSSKFSFNFYYNNESLLYNKNKNMCYINYKEFPKILPNINNNIIEFKEFIIRIEKLLILSWYAIIATLHCPFNVIMHLAMSANIQQEQINIKYSLSPDLSLSII